MRQTALIVDDERLARSEMRRLLAAHDDITVVGEAESVAGAIALIDRLKPTLVFLDIQLANESGFDLLERTPRTFRVIFVTAFDIHAIRAFEVNAFDYLLKPVNPDRLATTLARVKDDGLRADPLEDRPLEYEDRILVDVADRSVLLTVRDISHITAAGDYSVVVTSSGDRYLQQRSLREWEARLPAKHFQRIHRQALINLAEIVGVDTETGTSRILHVRLKSGETALAVSRRYSTKLRHRFA